jgi:hypothetical protein
VVDVNERKMFGHSAGNSKSLGAPKFVSRDDLFDSAWGLLQVGRGAVLTLAQEDTLTVVCEMHVYTGELAERPGRKGEWGEGSPVAGPPRS